MNNYSKIQKICRHGGLHCIEVTNETLSKRQEFEKKAVIVEGNPIKISDVLMDGLKEAPLKYEKGFTYPCFELITL